MTNKVNLSQFAGVNHGTDAEARKQSKANAREARGDVSREHGEAIKRRTLANSPWAPFASN